MSSQLVVLTPLHSYRQAIECLTQYRLTVLPVVQSESDRIFLGFLSEKGILQASLGALDQGDREFLNRSISWDPPFFKLTPSSPLEEVHQWLAQSVDRHLPILDASGRLQGLITRRDLIRSLYIRMETPDEDSGGLWGAL